ncbi:pyridoxal phosphate-dependent transferase [Pyrenochaeta sp. MPI-SDFR-AT-0127]|nr:pyridoxal phosphate-dependent transferase [Pyrenochaeta sp. MPI-SDFR-AT-0127]
MAPGALFSARSSLQKLDPSPVPVETAINSQNYLFNRSAKHPPLRVVRGFGNYYKLEDGSTVYDASCGAAVCGLGRYDVRVEEAMIEEMRLGLSYVPSLGFDTEISASLAQSLITSTDGELNKAVFYGSGSEAAEAALKIAIQYHVREKEFPEPSRTMFIARERSYHGATLGALDVSGHTARKALYKDILKDNVSLLSPCYPYRDRQGRTDEQYVQALKDELEAEIQRLGPHNVAGFIMEPIVGAALGCVAAVEGYMSAMREVCDKHGIILVFDEVMCGMGRTGKLHAWQHEGVVPDVQLIGKGLAGGFQAISGMLVGAKIVDAFENGSANGAFNHGHTFQNFPLACAAALAVQKIIQDDHLLDNVKAKGQSLEKKLRKRLGGHRNVGDIRGKGLFWGIEFVQDKQSKMPFLRKDTVAENLYHKGLCMPGGGIHIYPGAGTVDGINGDHIIIAPAYNITDGEVDFIVSRVGKLIDDFFNDFNYSRE